MSVYLYRKYNFSDDLGEQPMLFLKGRTDVEFGIPCGYALWV